MSFPSPEEFRALFDLKMILSEIKWQRNMFIPLMLTVFTIGVSMDGYFQTHLQKDNKIKCVVQQGTWDAIQAQLNKEKL